MLWKVMTAGKSCHGTYYHASMIELINYERLVDGCLDRKYELAQILAVARLQVSPPAPRRPASTRAGKRTKRRLVQRIPRDPDAAAHKPHHAQCR